MKLNVELYGLFLDVYIQSHCMSAEMILVGLILFGGMTAAAVKIWLNKRKERMEQEFTDENHA